MPLKKPIKIGKYEVVGLLGKGGMGVVYKANDPLLGRSVAIKMMTTLDYVDNPDLLQRFYREAQSTGNYTIEISLPSTSWGTTRAVPIS